MRWVIIASILLFSCSESKDKEYNDGQHESIEAEATVSDNNESDQDQYHYVWEDSFTEDQKAKVKTWIDSVANSVQRTLGQYPFDITFTIFKYPDADEPVPWAHTKRGKQQGVHFYINPNFSLDDFLEDWTAQHEISHLAIPFLGKPNAWFAEGFATFLQSQVMHQMGIFTDEQLEAEYQKNFSQKRADLALDVPMDELLNRYKSQGQYSLMYWGGVTYFYGVNEKLKAQGSSIPDVLKSYSKCCRMDDHDLKDVLHSLDRQLEGKVFYDEYWWFKKASGKEVMKAL